MTRRIKVISNPASGDANIEKELLEEIFGEYDVEWSLSLTEGEGDARRFAEEAVEDGVDIVVAYGGDGTVAEVASALVGTSTAMAIVPGGTANVVALELGIPMDTGKATHLLCGDEGKRDKIDVGMIGDKCFLLRIGIGFEAKMIVEADRDQKNQLGFLAYLWSGVRHLAETDVAHYRFRIDGNEIECKGFTCAIANSGSLGMARLRLGDAISVRDGKLDVVVIEDLNVQSVIELLGEVFGNQELTGDAREAAVREYTANIESMLQHWQGSEIEVEMDPMQVVQYDGEPLEDVTLPLKCTVLERQLTVIVPEE